MKKQALRGRGLGPVASAGQDPVSSCPQRHLRLLTAAGLDQGGPALPWPGGRARLSMMCCAVGIGQANRGPVVPGDPRPAWRPRLKRRLCSACSKGSMEPPCAQVSPIHCLGNGGLRCGPSGDPPQCPPCSVHGRLSKWQEHQWKGGRAAEGGYPSSLPTARPVLPARYQPSSLPGQPVEGAQLTQASSGAGAHGGLLASSATISLVSTACLQCALKATGNSGRPLGKLQRD